MLKHLLYNKIYLTSWCKEIIASIIQQFFLHIRQFMHAIGQGQYIKEIQVSHIPMSNPFSFGIKAYDCFLV